MVFVAAVSAVVVFSFDLLGFRPVFFFHVSML